MENFSNFADINNIKTLSDLFRNKLDEQTIKSLPCNALQSYNDLHNHYIKVKKEIYNNLLNLGINNPNEIINTIENSEITCEDYYDNDDELVDKINQNKIDTYIDYTKLFVYIIILCMFISFIYFFERRRCICPVIVQKI
jgi:hypothetical protein